MSGIIGKSPNMNSGIVGEYPVGHIIDFQSTTFPSAQYQSASTSGSVFVSTDSVTVSNVPAGGKLVAQFFGGFGEPSSGYGNTWGFRINGTNYTHLGQAGAHRANNLLCTYPISKSITFTSSTDNVVVNVIAERTGGSYIEFRLGGASPAELFVYVIV